MSKRFRATFKDNTYEFKIYSDEAEKLTFAYSGTVSTIYREAMVFVTAVQHMALPTDC